MSSRASFTTTSPPAGAYAYDVSARVRSAASYAYNTLNHDAASAAPPRFNTCSSNAPGAFVYYYGLRFYNPGTGRWLNPDPIGERGGLNLYGFVGNEPVGRWDYLGLSKKGRSCATKIVVRHGASPDTPDEGGDNIVTLKDTVKQWAKKAPCGDRVGAVGCFSGDVMATVPPDKKIPDTAYDVKDDPKIPNYVDGQPNPKEPGFLSASVLAEAIEADINSAKEQAIKDCDDPKTCCASVSISVYCANDGDENSVWNLALKTERGKKACNFKASYDCKSKVWK